MGLYLLRDVGDLPAFRKGTTIAFLQSFGIYPDSYILLMLWTRVRALNSEYGQDLLRLFYQNRVPSLVLAE